MYYFKHIPAVIQKIVPGVIWKIKTDDPLIFLTFDDGPHPDSTPVLLDLLDFYKFKATFFCLGKNVERYPDLLEKIRKRGHFTAIHGYEHLSGWKVNHKKYLQNLEKGKLFISSPFFRPPYGRITPRQYFQIRKKYKILMWSHMAGDFDHKLSADKIIASLKKHLNKGEIIVFHDNPNSIEKLKALLPEYFEFLIRNKFLPATLKELST